MKNFRIVYWFNSCVTDCYVKADTEQQAAEKFKKQKGEKRIVCIELAK